MCTQTALGGWMLMENFMNGFPGREMQLRQILGEVLGKEKSEYFFDKFLEYFFTESDAKFLASLGFNSLRLPLNYHHFEDDMNPMIIKEAGFKHVDRVIALVRWGKASLEFDTKLQISVQSTEYIRLLIYTPRQGGNHKIGIAIILQVMLLSGTISTSKTEWSISGNSSQRDIVPILG